MERYFKWGLKSTTWSNYKMNSTLNVLRHSAALGQFHYNHFEIFVSSKSRQLINFIKFNISLYCSCMTIFQNFYINENLILKSNKSCNECKKHCSTLSGNNIYFRFRYLLPASLHLGVFVLSLSWTCLELLFCK